MKKFTGLVFVLLAMHTIQAMNVVKPLTNEQCMRVALYLSFPKNSLAKDRFEKKKKKELFCNHPVVQKVSNFLLTIDKDTDEAIAFLSNIPSMKPGEMISETKKLQENVRLIGGILSRSNTLVFMTYNQDFFAAMCQACLPEIYEDRSGFFNGKYNSEAREINSKNPPLHKIFFTREEMVLELSKKNFQEAFSFFRFAEMKKSRPSKGRMERIVSDSSCTKVANIQRIPSLDYQWTYEDYDNLTDLQRLSLDTILECSNNYGNGNIIFDWDEDKDPRYVIIDKDINMFAPQKDEKKSNPNEKKPNPVVGFILGNDKYGNALIKTDISPSTKWENFCNKLLYWGPYALVMIIPDLVQSQINGVYSSAIGIAVCTAGSFGFGEYIYPTIDSYNSNVYKLSQWFGPNNHRKKRAGSDFVYLSVISSLANLVAQKFLSWPALPWKVLGGGIHAIRALLSGMTLINMENTVNKDPFDRKNKDGASFTMRDLVNGPKFAEQR